MMKSDTQLQEDVLAELKWEPSVNADHIGVEVNDGVVTLAGHVENHAEKWGAERAAQRVSGVKALAVEMKIDLLGLAQRSDADIAHTAGKVLSWMSNLPKDSVRVMVENGWITLSGQVDWHYQRQAASEAVRYLMGVTGVSDQITIAPKVSRIAVKSDIEAALKRRARSDAKEIEVKVDGAEVTLSGTVDTWAEHDLAVHSAWSTSGVRTVIDNICLG